MNTMTHPVAILMVNDERAATAGRGIDFCLDQLAQFTDPDTYRVYLWNNELTDGALCARLSRRPTVTYLETAPYERLAHRLAVPLQRLYARARAEGATRLVTFAPDAYPVRHGWLPALLAALDAGMALAGLWSDAAPASCTPSIHPSCLATTVNFVEQHQLRFDHLAAAPDTPWRDLLAHFTAAAQAANWPIHRLHRGHDNACHPGGAEIYGELICLQGAVDDRPHDGNIAKPSKHASASSSRPPLFGAVARARSLVHQVRAQLTSTFAWRTDYAKMLRPVALTDLHPVPVGWQITGPTFIGVGAPKCGTSWWYQLLLEHPQVVPNRVKGAGRKELFYFTHFQQQPLPAAAIAHYQQFFAAPPGAIVGEFTPSYLAYPNCLEQIARANPDAKILVMLRNPIDRLLSHLNHLHRNRAKWFRTLPADVLQLVHHYPIYCEAALHSLYAVGLRRLCRYFAPSQVLVLQYEHCRQSPATELARTYRFLGVPDDYQPTALQRKVNEIPYQLPRYNPAERKFLADYFADDVQQTVALCPAIDLALWPDFVSNSTIQ